VQNIRTMSLAPQSRLPGIIGGVGPKAGIDLQNRIFAIRHAQGARRDQDHIRYLLDSNCQIPDRTEAILRGGTSPVQAMRDSVGRLLKGGASFIGIPCNTAHVFLPEVQKAFPETQFLHMIREVMRDLKRRGVKTAGLLSTAGTAASGVYQKAGEGEGIGILTPDRKGIERVMSAIYDPDAGIKAGFERTDRNVELFLGEIRKLSKQGIEAVIMGCTEIPLCLRSEDTELPLVDPTQVLAEAIVREATAKEM